MYNQSDNIDFSVLTKAYEEASIAGAEPDLIILASIKKTKAVRRKVGRMIKKGQIPSNRVLWPFIMKNKYGALIV